VSKEEPLIGVEEHPQPICRGSYSS
jgi:hypothetical protein